MTSFRARLQQPSRLAAAFALLIALGACDTPTVCHTGIAYRVTPADTTLLVGQLLEPAVRVSACGSLDGRAVGATFASLDTTVVRVDSLTPRLRAVGPGEARIAVSDSIDRQSLGFVRISVVTAP